MDEVLAKVKVPCTNQSANIPKWQGGPWAELDTPCLKSLGCMRRWGRRMESRPFPVPATVSGDIQGSDCNEYGLREASRGVNPHEGSYPYYRV